MHRIEREREMKLTTTQQKVYDEIVTKINNARDCKDYEEYWNKYYADRIQARWKPDYEIYYIENLKGIVGVYRAKHETLKKLETLGLVKIIDIKLDKIQLIE